MATYEGIKFVVMSPQRRHASISRCLYLGEKPIILNLSFARYSHSVSLFASLWKHTTTIIVISADIAEDTLSVYFLLYLHKGETSIYRCLYLGENPMILNLSFVGYFHAVF